MNYQNQGGSLFGNNQGQGQGQQQGNSLFNKPQGGQGQGGQGQQQGQNSLFNRGGQGQGGQTSLFGTQGGQGGQGGGTSLFGNGGQMGQGGQGGGTSLFGNNQTGGTSLFGNNQSGGGGGGVLFGNNQSGGNMFTQQTQNPYGTSSYGYNQQGQQGNHANFSQVNQAQFFALLNANQSQHKKLFDQFTTDYIKQLILFYRKTLDSTKVDRLVLSNQNPNKNEKLSKIATTGNYKDRVIQLKKGMRDNLKVKIDKLNVKEEKIELLSHDFVKSVFEKLEKYKKKLVQTVSMNKMIDEIKKEVDELDKQIKEFFKPLFNAYQNRSNYPFTDPDPFCIKVSQMVIKNMTYLDNKVDELLACESETSQETLDTAEVIQQLIEYYENVALTVKEFADKYNRFKRSMANRINHSNPDEVIRKISERANAAVSKDMQSYDIVKEIESLLTKRQGDGLRLSKK